MTSFLDEIDRGDTELVPVPAYPWRVKRQPLSEGNEGLLQRQQLRRRLLKSLEHLTGVSALRLEEGRLSGIVRFEPAHPEDVANWRRLGVVELDTFSDLPPETSDQVDLGLPGSTFAASVLKLGALTGLAEGATAVYSTRIDLLLAMGAKSVARIALRVHALATGGQDAHLKAMELADETRIHLEQLLSGGDANASEDAVGFQDFAGRIPEMRELVQIAALNGQAALAFGSLRQEIQGLRASLAMAHRQVQEQEADLEMLRHQVSAMRAGLSARSLQEPAEDEMPEQATDEDLDWLPQWAQDNAHRITIMPRALAGAKKSLYEHPEHVRPALEFLAGPYRQARMGEIDREAMEKALRASGCQMRGSAGTQTAGEAGAAYFVRWRNSLRFMDMHLTRGGGHDQRYCMRIYWFWDADSKQVIVGHLPQHLPNSLS